MHHSLLKLALFSLAAVAGPSVPVSAKQAPEISAEANRLAAGGYDVTAYFQQGKPLRGSATHQLQHKGATWRFASAGNLAKFKADPGVYAPQFGGYCAWAVSQGYVAPGDPDQWKIVDGKLYLNFNARAKELWEADQADAIRRGHGNWPMVLSKNQDSR